MYSRKNGKKNSRRKQHELAMPRNAIYRGKRVSRRNIGAMRKAANPSIARITARSESARLSENMLSAVSNPITIHHSQNNRAFIDIFGVRVRKRPNKTANTNAKYPSRSTGRSEGMNNDKKIAEKRSIMRHTLRTTQCSIPAGMIRCNCRRVLPYSKGRAILP